MFARVRSWAYQLQNINVEQLSKCPADLLVIDSTIDGTRSLTSEELYALRKQGTRRVLCYLSIGEAESYRPYWRKPWNDDSKRPDWILDQNPDWPGNYAVQFWHPDWSAICRRMITLAMKQGFDGVYLDKADVVWDLADPEKVKLQKQMVEFILGLAKYAREQNPNFMVIMQNAEHLLSYKQLRDALDGVAKEELVYLDQELQGAVDIQDSYQMLNLMRLDNKLVLAVEYIDDIGQRYHAIDMLEKTMGFIPYFAKGDRALAQLGEIAA